MYNYLGIHMKRKNQTKGTCQGKKNPKIREKLGLARRHPPPPHLFNFFLNMYNKQNTQKNPQKT